VKTHLSPPHHDARLQERSTALYRIHEIGRLISTEFDQLVAKHNITRAQWLAYMHVAQNPGTKQTALAEQMQMGRAAAGKLFDKLEENGWIERRVDPRDHRAKLVYPRRDSPELLEIIPDAAVALYDKVYEGLTDDDVSTLLRILDKMAVNTASAPRH